MKIGISTASLFLRLNNEDALPLLRKWHVPCAEVFLTSFSEYDPRFASALAAAKGDVNVHSVHVLNTQFEPQLYAEHPRVREDAFGWLKKAMKSAQNLGARNYTFHGIARIKRTSSAKIFPVPQPGPQKFTQSAGNTASGSAMRTWNGRCTTGRAYSRN